MSACAIDNGGEIVVYGFNNSKEFSIVSSPYMPKARIMVGAFSASEMIGGQNIVVFDEKKFDYKFLENAMWVKEPVTLVRDRFVQVIDDQFNSNITKPAQEYSVRAHFVITSYSIHYTKLYDMVAPRSLKLTGTILL